MTLNEFLRNNDFSFLYDNEQLKLLYKDKEEFELKKIEEFVKNKERVIGLMELLKHIEPSKKNDKAVICDTKSQYNTYNLYCSTIFPNGDRDEYVKHFEYTYEQLLNMELQIKYHYIDEQSDLFIYFITLFEFLTDGYKMFTQEQMDWYKTMRYVKFKMYKDFNNIEEVKKFKSFLFDIPLYVLGMSIFSYILCAVVDFDIKIKIAFVIFAVLSSIYMTILMFKMIKSYKIRKFHLVLNLFKDEKESTDFLKKLNEKERNDIYNF